MWSNYSVGTTCRRQPSTYPLTFFSVFDDVAKQMIVTLFEEHTVVAGDSSRKVGVELGLKLVRLHFIIPISG